MTYSLFSSKTRFESLSKNLIMIGTNLFTIARYVLYFGEFMGNQYERKDKKKELPHHQTLKRLGMDDLFVVFCGNIINDERESMHSQSFC